MTNKTQHGGARWRIGVDVGGTFTDLVLADAAGAVDVVKVPSTPEDPAQGVLDGLAAAAERCHLPLGDFLARCTLLVHGSTIATNTVLEGKGARVGLLATQGFGDELEIRRGRREDPWDHRTPFPPVLVPRYLRLQVGGRIGKDGEEVAPLVLADVDQAVATFREEGVESIAICLFNSFLAPRHERAAAARVREQWNGAWLSVSADIAPLIGEYERTSTTVMNAYIAPRTVGYLRALQERLAALGLKVPMLLIQNNGGAVSLGAVSARPAALLLSGPAAGVGALDFYSRAIGSDDLISMEIGGTSCDVILMDQGQVAVSDQFAIGGYHMAIPSVDVYTIGAGGGTIATVDAGGLLTVGPQGAGARPGPASYGLGGTQPTVTDAQLVLGRLKPGPYAGGAITLDGRAAHAAIERQVAAPLGLGVEESAVGIVRLLEQNLLHAVQRISIERGYDPRRFTLVAAGGAGPMHGAAVGRLLGCKRVYVPRLSGAFCALGMLHSNVRHDFVRTLYGRLDTVDAGVVEGHYAEMAREAKAVLGAEGFAAAATEFAREMDLRYVGQSWDVRAPVSDGALDKAAVRTAFEHNYERLYGHTQPGGIVELTHLRLVGIGKLPALNPGAPEAAKGAPVPAERRRAYLGAAHGWGEVPVYRGADLRPGHDLAGPLLIEEVTTTVVVGPKDRLHVDPAGNFAISLLD
ncbi:MAG: hydantoinase/oxoprolinase family protein [Alphaproteobacteria bacterium]|nr:hydantoinase/oxoprolinase family protein [Alphaproteobacteria bacterium]